MAVGLGHTRDGLTFLLKGEVGGPRNKGRVHNCQVILKYPVDMRAPRWCGRVRHVGCELPATIPILQDVPGAATEVGRIDTRVVWVVHGI